MEFNAYLTALVPGFTLIWYICTCEPEGMACVILGDAHARTGRAAA